MNDFEKQLTKALQRVDAPEDFAECVMQRLNVEYACATTQVSKARPGAPRLWPRFWHLPRAWFGVAGFATAALLLAGVVGGERMHERHLREAEATQQFETATRITDQALEPAREHLARAGVSLEQ
jgi:hypothetical protein